MDEYQKMFGDMDYETMFPEERDLYNYLGQFPYSERSGILRDMEAKRRERNRIVNAKAKVEEEERQRKYRAEHSDTIYIGCDESVTAFVERMIRQANRIGGEVSGMVEGLRGGYITLKATPGTLISELLKFYEDGTSRAAQDEVFRQCMRGLF